MTFPPRSLKHSTKICVWIGHDSSNERTDHESQTECSTDHTHSCLQLLIRTDVSNVGACNCNISISCSGQKSDNQCKPKALCQTKCDEENRIRNQAEHDDWTAANSIRKRSQDRREKKLSERVCCQYNTNP